MQERRGELILRPSWFGLDLSRAAPGADKGPEPDESPLKWTAIKKHLHPSCNSSRDAEDFSEERDRLFPTEVNHVFKADKNDFTTIKEDGENIVKSKQKVRNWKCVKSQGNFRVRGSTEASKRTTPCPFAGSRAVSMLRHIQAGGRSSRLPQGSVRRSSGLPQGSVGPGQEGQVIQKESQAGGLLV